ncbi:unnamed protein product [Phaedon cochleariae]|uniref:Uncharacterized protein n=1 Tax=Phaedon cochleariae TaxID=80249 RepID=A0A9P0GS30_PHACE|nr:unnamed protein product [Phaedon cochleariae]
MDCGLTLDKAIEKITQSERIKEENRELRGKKENDIGRVMQRGTRGKDEWEENEHSNKVEEEEKTCPKCGKSPNHSRFKYTANKVRCKKCKIVGHYAIQCRTKNSRHLPTNPVAEQ